MRFEALHYPDRLHLVNPCGDVGIVSLWSPLKATLRRLVDVSPGVLDPGRSRVAVVANLYGDGMYAMFCNLLFNPQIRHLVAVGEDLGLPTCQEIEAFLEHGLEDAVLLGRELRRVVGTERLFPAIAEFDADRLRRTLGFRYLGRLATLDDTLDRYLAGLPALPTHAERLRVELPRFDADDYAYRPSELAGHEVIRRRPLDCWEELVVRGVRFGRPVELRDGPRLELLNAKAVITEPAAEPADVLARYGFQLDRFEAYQKKILRPELPAGISYTYGNRLLGHFGPDGTKDTLGAVIHRLRDNPEARGGYIALWDTTADLPEPGDETDTAAPCLTTLFFRRTDGQNAEGRLSLTATYRSHNLLSAWLENVYGLMAIQRLVADGAGMAIGPITVVSHSLGIDPRSPRYALARGIAEAWKRDDDVDRVTGRHSLREDPNGYFVVSVDAAEGCIVAEHRFGGLLIKQYRSDRAAKIEREIGADMAVSLVSHALWLGRELMAKEHQLRTERKSR